MAIKVVIREEVFIQGLPVTLVDLFMKENTFRNPKIDVLERLGKWTGGEPKYIKLYRQKEDWLAFPRGYWVDISKKLEEFGITPVVRWDCPPITQIDRISTQGQLFDYQWNALQELMARATGVMEAPTGSGKTNILLTLIAELSVPTLVVVHTTELLKQTVDRCRSWLGVEAGIIGGGKERLENITIGMIQTLSKMEITKTHPLYTRFNCVIVDECHHSPALTWAEVLRRLPYRYKYGFTATAWRKDKLDFIIWRMIGPITAKVYHQDVADAGRIVWPEIKQIFTNYYYPIQEPSEWGEMITDLTENQERNLLIAHTVSEYLGRFPNDKALILTDRIEHAERLALLGRTINPVVLTGKLKPRERTEAMEQIRGGARLTIATVHLLGEGVDVPGWSLLFLVSPFSGGPRVLQAVGRVARPAPGKERALLLDFIDNRIPMLKNAAYARAKLYRTKGE